MTTTTQNHRLGIEVEQRGRVLLARPPWRPARRVRSRDRRRPRGARHARRDRRGRRRGRDHGHPPRAVRRARQPALAARGGRREPQRRAARRLGGRPRCPRDTGRCRSAQARRPHAAQRRDGAPRRARDVPADEPLRRGVHRRAQRLGARHRIRARAGLRLPAHGRRATTSSASPRSSSGSRPAAAEPSASCGWSAPTRDSSGCSTAAASTPRRPRRSATSTRSCLPTS